MYSDDNDNRNYNGTWPYGGADFLAFDAIVGGDRNTMYDIAQVQ